MTKLSYIAAILLIAGLTSAASCGDESPNTPPACVVDEECLENDQFCYAGACTQSCATDADCGIGLVCRSELRVEQDDVVNVCVLDEQGNNGSVSTCEDEECVESLDNPRARCSGDGFCFVPELVFGLLVRDTTAVVTPPNAAEDGGLGADIVTIYLEDSGTGEPVAWADTVSVSPANDVVPRNLPTGEAEALLEDGTCSVAPFEEAATPLGGDGGYLLVRFLDSVTGNPVTTPPETWRVVVVEWDQNCGATGEPDLYEIWACEASSFKSMDAGRDCLQRLAPPASGRLEIDGAEK